MNQPLTLSDLAKSLATHLDLLSHQGVSGFDCDEKCLKILQNGWSGGAESAGNMAAMAEETQACTQCSLHKGRFQTVFGQGAPKAKLMFIGLAPGLEESEAGLPFQGEVGELLSNIINAMGLSREEVYLCNLVKCPVLHGQAPAPEHIQACSKYVRMQIAQVTPRVICTLGEQATQAILKQDNAFSIIRGKLQPYLGMKVMPTYHPVELLTTPQKKRALWQDMQAIMRTLGTSIT